MRRDSLPARGERETAPHCPEGGHLPPKYCPSCGKPLSSRPVDGKERPSCRQCGFVVFQDPKVVAGVVVSKGGQVLLVRRGWGSREGTWTFPSGYVDLGEEVEEAARREALEEAGVEVELEGLLGVYSGGGRPMVLVVYAGKLKGGEARPPKGGSGEISEVGFFSPPHWPELSYPFDRQALDEWARRYGGK